MTIRAFIAVDPSPEIVRRITEKIRVWEPKTKGFRWVRPEALHLTLRFLGEVDEATLAQVDERLGQLVPTLPSMSLSVEGVGFFPNPEKPRVAWAGLTGDCGPLEELQKKIHEAVSNLSVHPEKDREFSPHLTLARIPNWRGSSGVNELLKASPEWTLGSFSVDRVFLYKSRLTPEGASYSKLKEYFLRRP